MIPFLVGSRLAISVLTLPDAVRWLHRAPSQARWNRHRLRQGIIVFNALAQRLRDTPLRLTCWDRALMLRRLLAISGLESRIVLGVRSTGSTIEGHAWVERDGKAVGDSTTHAYRRVYAFPEKRIPSPAQVAPRVATMNPM